MKKILCILAAMSMCVIVFPQRQCIAGRHSFTAKGARIRANQKAQQQQKQREQQSPRVASVTPQVPKTDAVEQSKIIRNPGNRNFRNTRTGGTRL